MATKGKSRIRSTMRVIGMAKHRVLSKLRSDASYLLIRNTAICTVFDLRSIREELHDRKTREAARADIENNYQRVCKAWREQRDFIMSKAEFDCAAKCRKALAQRDADLAILEGELENRTIHHRADLV